MSKAPPLGTVGTRTAAYYARHDLKQAQANLWRARKWGYENFEIAHFERLVLAHLDYVWDAQERERKMEEHRMPVITDPVEPCDDPNCWCKP